MQREARSQEAKAKENREESNIAVAEMLAARSLPGETNGIEGGKGRRGNVTAPSFTASSEEPRLLLSNRVREVTWHIPWYGFKTQVRLAQDSGVSPAAISRLIRGHSQPSLFIALRVNSALSRRLGKTLDVGEVFSLDGSYPTPSVCDLCNCQDWLPPTAYGSDDQLKSEFKGVKAGQWSSGELQPTRLMHQEAHAA